MKHLAVIIAAVIAAGSIGCSGTVPPCAHVAPPVSAVAERPCAMRAEAGALWASAGVWAEPRRAWTMPARGAVESLAVDPMPGDAGYVVTFRQGGVVWRGQLDASREARGQLRPVAVLRDATDATAQR